MIDLAVFVEQPPAVAWRALTEPGLISRWLAPVAGFSAVEGTTFMVQADIDRALFYPLTPTNRPVITRCR